MPVPRYLDENYQMGNAFASMGNTMNSLATALPQMRMSADRYQQQLMLAKAQEILREAQTKSANARAGLDNARTLNEYQKLGQQQQMGMSAQSLGQAKAMAELLGNKSISYNDPVSQQMFIDAGLAGKTFERDSIVGAYNAAARGQAAGIAGLSPTAAASLLTQSSIPQGGTGVDRLGATGVMGQPKPLVMSPNTVAYTQGQPTDFGAIVLNRGQQYTPPGAEEPTAFGQPFPDTEKDRFGNLLPQIWKDLDRKRQEQFLAKHPEILGETNAPSTKLPRLTRAQAADVVKQFGDPKKAIEAMKQQGYDTSGYAD